MPASRGGSLRQHGLLVFKLCHVRFYVLRTFLFCGRFLLKNFVKVECKYPKFQREVKQQQIMKYYFLLKITLTVVSPSNARNTVHNKTIIDIRLCPRCALPSPPSRPIGRIASFACAQNFPDCYLLFINFPLTL